ncbi:unnamed protein product [Closterium sp. NIES-53]
MCGGFTDVDLGTRHEEDFPMWDASHVYSSCADYDVDLSVVEELEGGVKSWGGSGDVGGGCHNCRKCRHASSSLSSLLLLLLLCGGEVEEVL